MFVLFVSVFSFTFVLVEFKVFYRVSNLWPTLFKVAKPQYNLLLVIDLRKMKRQSSLLFRHQLCS